MTTSIVLDKRVVEEDVKHISQQQSLLALSLLKKIACNQVHPLDGTIVPMRVPGYFRFKPYDSGRCDDRNIRLVYHWVNEHTLECVAVSTRDDVYARAEKRMVYQGLTAHECKR